jgi:fumarate reductase flavoprotein subunit
MWRGFLADDFDVIVVGGGGAGLSAAIEAKEAGASVMVLEADTRLGGATGASAGVFYAANTSVQKARGIEDSADAMFDYVMAINQWALKPDIIRHICDESGPTIEWLISLGVKFPPEYLVCSGVESTPRGHPSEGAGHGIADRLISKAGALGIETALGTRVERLLTEDGRVVGVHAGGIELRAPVTIIATGGFGNNPDMVKRLFPSVARHYPWTWAVHDGLPFINGDGITMAEAIGAGITGHDGGLMLPTSGFGKFIEAFLPPWVMMVNDHGKRFVPECAAYTIVGYLIDEQPGHHAWCIFDEPTLIEASNDSSYLDPYNAGITTPIWEEETLRNHAASGRIKTGDTLEELATACGIDADGLIEQAARYNADCDAGHDVSFQKETPKMFPVRQAPFYAVEVKPAIIGLTGAGLDLDRQCRVLDTAGRAIPGLFAAGETCGVSQGKRYAGGGFSIAPAVILGREAGRQAAREALGR